MTSSAILPDSIEISNNVSTTNTKQQPLLNLNWYQKVKPDQEIDRKLYEKPFSTIFEGLAREFDQCTIDVILKQFKAVFSEFYELSAPFRTNTPNYNRHFEALTTRLCTIYQIEREIMLVQAYRYTTRDWGHIYWDFLHLTSILLTHAKQHNLMTANETTLDFPLLLYNIDTILPCSICVSHYKSVKSSPEIKQCIKMISFGWIMTGTQTFHNQITANIDKRQNGGGIVQRPPFLLCDFATKYNCIDIRNEGLLSSRVFVPGHISWEPITHVYLSILLASFCGRESYGRTSLKLKAVLYANEPKFTVTATTRNDMVSLTNNATMLMVDVSDRIFFELTSNQIKMILCDTIVEHIADVKRAIFGTTNSDEIEQTQQQQRQQPPAQLIHAVCNLCFMYPESIQQMIKVKYANANDAQQQNRARLLEAVNEIYKFVSAQKSHHQQQKQQQQHQQQQQQQYR